ncbi:MAG: CAP domain-containing protein [Bacteroidota bacterium]
MRSCLFLIVILSFSSALFSQPNEKHLIDDDHFKLDSLPGIILQELNRFRVSRGLDTLQVSEMLVAAAELSSEKMSESNNDKVDRLTTLKHLKTAGATKRGEEVTMKAQIGKGKFHYKTEDVAKVIYSRWESNPKNLPAITNSKYTLVGISCALDKERKKVYVSAVFGGYDINNGGVIYKNQLPVPFNNRSKTIKIAEAKTCKSCEQWRNYDLLHKGLYVYDNKIYLKYNNARDLQRILKNTRDGLAVDVVQRGQYINAYYNIVDNNQYHKGIMSKIIYRDKFFKMNQLVTDDKKTTHQSKAIEVQMDKFNPAITGQYEINLIIIQNGKICKTITRGYTESGMVESNTPIGLLPAPGSKGLMPAFEPRPESAVLTLTIPFEKSRSEFKDEDVKPFVRALNEPDFIIDSLHIYTYASIEGDSATNSLLQRKRAESVVKVLQSFQKNKISPNIETRDSWDLFTTENKQGKYAWLVSLGKQKAIAKINADRKLQAELEPLLTKERFAQIAMNITYDVSGSKESKFSIVNYRRALKTENLSLAYKIMEFVAKRVSEESYRPEILDSLKTAERLQYVGLLNNIVYYKYKHNSTVEEDDAATFTQLLKLDPDNPVLQYNKVFCQLKLDSNAGKKTHQLQVQQTIDGLYSKLDSNYVNGLNIEWQFKIMETLDTLENAQIQTDECIKRIKSFYKISDASWQNGLKLSYVFSRARDYKYSATLLEPYLNMPGVPENLLFMYLSSASRVPEKYYSRTFARAMELAQEVNPARYCKLIGAPFMTFQVLENPEVKKVYQNNCGDKN